jgi:hypothetical protein
MSELPLGNSRGGSGYGSSPNRTTIETHRQLQAILKSKDKELLELREALESNLWKNSFFLSNKSRDLFWKLVNKCENSNDRVHRMELEFRAHKQEIEMENHDLKRKLEDGQEMIDKLSMEAKQVANLKVGNTKLRDQIANEQKRLQKETSREVYSPKDHQMFQQKVAYYESAFTVLNGRLQTSINEYNKEKSDLHTLIKIKEPMQSRAPTQKATNEMRATEIFYSKNSEYNIEQMLLRFNSVESDSDKFVEMLTLMFGFYRLVTDELETFNERLTLSRDEKIEKEKAERLVVTLTNKNFYSQYIKGLVAEDLKVFEQTAEFL